MTIILGIDVGKDHLEVYLWRDGQAAESGQFANTEAGLKTLQRYLKKRSAEPVHVGLEATGTYYERVATFLYEQGQRVSVVNPAQIKAYASSRLSRNKTDRLDAALIADFCRTQEPPLWIPPRPEWQALRALVRHLADLESDVQRQRNRRHAHQRAAVPSGTVLAQLQAQIDLLAAQIQTVKRAIQEHIDQDPDLKRQRDLIASIKGLGELSAAKVLAEFPDLTAFTDVRQMVAFAGLNPKHHQSGTTIRGPTKISKMGAASLRAALFMPAVVAKQHNPLLQPWIERLTQRGLSRMEIVVAVMRKLLHLIYGVLKSGQPFDPHYLDNQTALTP